MARSRSDGVLRQVHRLFNVGAVGTMSDRAAPGQDRVAARRGREAAFEELVTPTRPDGASGLPERSSRCARRGGCVSGGLPRSGQPGRRPSARRSRSRAGCSGSRIAWRLAVSEAPRVGMRSTSVAAERTSESYLPAENDPDCEILHEEINSLARGALRTPIVLCYLEGLTYAAAAHQLGRLGDRAPWPAGPGARAVAPAADPAWCDGPGRSSCRRCGRSSTGGHPMTLIQCTIRIALGFMAGNTAAILARGVLIPCCWTEFESRRSCCALASGVATGPGMPSPRRMMERPKPMPARPS